MAPPTPPTAAPMTKPSPPKISPKMHPLSELLEVVELCCLFDVLFVVEE